MTTPIKHLLLDLDRTLFDTNRSFDYILIAAEACFGNRGISAKKMRDEYKNFYTSDDPTALRTYDFFEHLKSYGFAVTNDDIRVLRERVMNQGDLLFPDAHELLKYLETRPDLKVTILSFGVPQFQIFKCSLTPELEKYHMDCIFEEKGPFIKRTYEAEPSLIVDDKVIDDLPEWCRGVLLNRTTPEQSGVLEGHSHYDVINSLILVPSYLQS
jgi:hypothetical protein